MGPQRARGMARLAIIVVIVAVVAILIWNSGDSELVIFGKNPSYPHQVQITAPSAFEAMPGERVVEGGVGIGTIISTNVTRQAQAHIVMGISDQAWPIPTDSQFTLRMGGTIKFTDRFINITPGRAHSYFADNGSVPAKQFTVPVEYASLFNIFNPRTRTSLKAFFDNGGPTLAAAQQSFRRALQAAPPVLDQADHVFQDLSYNQAALSTLVSSTANLSDAIASSNPGIKNLIDGAAATFGTIGAHSTSLAQAIDRGHAFGNQVRVVHTLVAQTLPSATKLLQKLGPGVQQLNDIAAPLNATLQEVINVEPTAVDTLDTVKNAGPQLNTFLTKARTSLLPQLQSVSAQAAVELNCIRPYTPDITSFAQGWAGFFGDGLKNPHVHFLHTMISALPFPELEGASSKQITTVFPALHTEYPPPPGDEWGQPWYQPQCNITPTSIKNDPEAGTYDPNGSKIFPYGSTTPSYAPAPHPN